MIAKNLAVTEYRNLKNKVEPFGKTERLKRERDADSVLLGKGCFDVNELENSINFLKEQLIAAGEKWKGGMDVEPMRDCLAIVEAINVLEERAFGRMITTIAYIL